MERWFYLLGVVLLAAVGLGLAVFRHASTGVPVMPDEDRLVWQVEARVEFLATGAPAEALLTLPPEQDGFLAVRETGASPGFGFVVDQSGKQRRAHWTRRSATGEQVLFYQAELIVDPAHRIAPVAPDEVARPSFEGPYATAATGVLDAVLPRVTNAMTLAEQLVQAVNTRPLSQNMSLLLRSHAPAPLVSALLNEAGVAARTVKALPLADGRRYQRLRDYVQVWQEGDWLLYDLASGRLDDTSPAAALADRCSLAVRRGWRRQQPGHVLHDQPEPVRARPVQAARRPARPDAA